MSGSWDDDEIVVLVSLTGFFVNLKVRKDGVGIKKMLDTQIST